MYNSNISFILHKPQLSENIGACARAIKNFNFNKLLLIDPKPVFPNDKILATSVGAKDIVKKTKVYNNLLKLKFFIALAHAPIFSDNWGLCKIKEIFLKYISC